MACSTFIIWKSGFECESSIGRELQWSIPLLSIFIIRYNAKCKYPCFISLSGHLAAETLLCVTEQSFICVFIMAFIMAHLAGRVLHQRWWKFRCSYSQVILLNCSLIYMARLTVVTYSLGNRHIHLFFSIERQYDWIRVYVWESTLAKWPHQLRMKGGAAAQRSLDLQQEFNLKCSWEEGQRCVYSSCMLMCHLTGCALHVTDLYYALMKKSFSFSQAGDKHYHPSCARCSRCNQMFTEGEEMYLQGEQKFHMLARSLFFFFTVSFIWFQNDFKMSAV